MALTAKEARKITEETKSTLKAAIESIDEMIIFRALNGLDYIGVDSNNVDCDIYKLAIHYENQGFKVFENCDGISIYW